MRQRTLQIDGINYNTVKEAADAINVEYHIVRKFTERGITSSTELIKIQETIKKTRDAKQPAKKVTKPKLDLSNIDFSKEHSYEEIAQILFKLGLTNNVTSKQNIFYTERRAIYNFKQKLLEEGITEEELRHYLNSKN